jgi:hypothetical protein
MARNTVQHHSGFTFNYTDLNSNIFPPKDKCLIDTLGWTDLDGDGCVDFICIGTESGDYEDTDHEVVAIHSPTGERLWTALRGEASKKLSLAGGVVVVSTNSATQLRGLDPRTGQQLWQISLPDALNEDSFDGDDLAPAIAPLGGTWAGFECVDDSVHVIDVRTGQIVKSLEGQLRPQTWNLPGLVAFKTEGPDGDEILDIWDLAQGRSIYQAPDDYARTIHGGGYFGFLHRDDHGLKAAFFDAQSNQQTGATWIKSSSGGEPPTTRSEYGVAGAFLISGRLVSGDQHGDEQSAWTAPLGQQTAVAEPWSAPRPGHVMRGLAWCNPVLVSVWQKAKGTEKLVACGHDPNTLQPTWVVEDLGGSNSHPVPLRVTQHAVLVPRSNDNYFSPTNPAAIVHIDPTSGERVTDYPVEDTNCVAVVDHFLVGCPTYFSGGVPVAYDTWNRVRVL